MSFPVTVTRRLTRDECLARLDELVGHKVHVDAALPLWVDEVVGELGGPLYDDDHHYRVYRPEDMEYSCIRTDDVTGGELRSNGSLRLDAPNCDDLFGVVIEDWGKL
jgi:hypothetical protein